MAKEGAKKRKEQNERHIQRLQQIIVYANVVYIVVRVSVFFRSFSLLHWGGLLLTTFVYKGCFDQIVKLATPVYDDKGGLIDGGADLSMGGLCSYLHDIIYVTAFVQVTSILSDWFWLFYLTIPAYALWLLVSQILVPMYLQQSEAAEGTEDEKSRKRREKKERQAARAAKLMQQRR